MMAFRYKWNGSPYERKFDPKRCAASVHEPGRGVRIYQCQRKPQPGSEWCRQHSPEAEAERAAKQEAAYQKKMRVWSREAAGPDAIHAIEELLVAHADANADGAQSLLLRLPNAWIERLQAIVGRARR